MKNNTPGSKKERRNSEMLDVDLLQVAVFDSFFFSLKGHGCRFFEFVLKVSFTSYY